MHACVQGDNRDAQYLSTFPFIKLDGCGPPDSSTACLQCASTCIHDLARSHADACTMRLRD